ncbi:MAG: ComEC family competence protein [Mangrovicoccus sp.]|nr:ComEC family competence protein [Mangrovicoccus sp.]
MQIAWHLIQQAARFLAARIDQQRGALFAWLPVCLALGIGLYFALPVEPGGTVIVGLSIGAVMALAAQRQVPEALGPVLIALAAISAGVCLGAWRSHKMAAPMVEFRYYGPVQGRLIAMDRSISDKTRLLFDQVVLAKMDPAQTPKRVRISLHGDRSLDTALVPGKVLMLTAHLSAPRGPVEPGGFDFRRHAYFQQIGAVGYSRTPILAVAPPAPGLWIGVQRLRAQISQGVQSHLPGQKGAFAAAVLTGDRSGLSREVVDAMRATNLAHLLAISGLHMGLLTAVVFGALRFGLAAIPPLALRINSKKWAACGALLAAAAYLALSGKNVSTQRAFIMVAVMLCAVLLDRRALSLRAVALAACIVLILRPEALLGPGFQMSFAATSCLVWVFAGLRRRHEAGVTTDLPARWRRWLRPVAALVISSAVAGLATAPIGMAHFNSSASYGLPANLMSVPIMGSVVMPAAVLAAGLWLIGLEGLGLWIMGQGISVILWLADSFAALPQAVRHVPSPPGAVLSLIALGALWGMLWQGRARLAGPLVIFMALGVWANSPRPDLLISEDGRLIGVMTPQGRALSRDRGSGFAARAWLENDGDPSEPSAAHARWQAMGGDTAQAAFLPAAAVPESCAYEALVLALRAAGSGIWCTDPPQPSGALAGVYLGEGQWHWRSTRAQIGQRPWTPPRWRSPQKRRPLKGAFENLVHLVAPTPEPSR